MILKVTLSEDERRGVDAVRGGVPAATWIRQLVHDALVAADALRPGREAAALEAAAVGPPALEDAAGTTIDPASVTGVRVEAGSMLPEYLRPGH